MSKYTTSFTNKGWQVHAKADWNLPWVKVDGAFFKTEKEANGYIYEAQGLVAPWLDKTLKRSESAVIGERRNVGEVNEAVYTVNGWYTGD